MINALLLAGADPSLVQKNKYHLIVALILFFEALPEREFYTILQKVLGGLFNEDIDVQKIKTLIELSKTADSWEELKAEAISMLKEQEKVNLHTNEGEHFPQTPFQLLIAACIEGEVKAVEQLLDSDITLASQQSFAGNTPLLVACISEKYDAAKAIIERVDRECLDIKNYQGRAAIYVLAHAKKPPHDVIHRLVMKQANPKLNGRADSVVINAMLKNWNAKDFIDVFKVILSFGFNLNLRDPQNYFPLQVALCEISDNEILADVLSLLIEYGAQVDYRWLKATFDPLNMRVEINEAIKRFQEVTAVLFIVECATNLRFFNSSERLSGEILNEIIKADVDTSAMHAVILNAVKQGISLQQIEVALRGNGCETFILAQYPRGMQALTANYSKQMRYGMVLAKSEEALKEILQESSSYAENFEKLKNTGFMKEVKNPKKPIPKSEEQRNPLRTISEKKFSALYTTALSPDVGKMTKHITDPDVLNSSTPSGETFLMRSCKERNFELFNVLLSAGANLNIQTQAGECALSIFVGKCRNNRALDAECSKFILDLIVYGANPKIGDADEIFLINMFITYKSSDPNFLKQLRSLIENIGDINREDPRGFPVLFVAVVKIPNKTIRLQTVLLLLEFGASPIKKSSGGKTSAYELVQALAKDTQAFDAELKLFESLERSNLNRNAEDIHQPLVIPSQGPALKKAAGVINFTGVNSYELKDSFLVLTFNNKENCQFANQFFQNKSWKKWFKNVEQKELQLTVTLEDLTLTRKEWKNVETKYNYGWRQYLGHQSSNDKNASSKQASSSQLNTAPTKSQDTPKLKNPVPALAKNATSRNSKMKKNDAKTDDIQHKLWEKTRLRSLEKEAKQRPEKKPHVDGITEDSVLPSVKSVPPTASAPNVEETSSAVPQSAPGIAPALSVDGRRGGGIEFTKQPIVETTLKTKKKRIKLQKLVPHIAARVQAARACFRDFSVLYDRAYVGHEYNLKDPVERTLVYNGFQQYLFQACEALRPTGKGKNVEQEIDRNEKEFKAILKERFFPEVKKLRNLLYAHHL